MVVDRGAVRRKELHDHRLIQPHHFSQAINGGLVHMFTQQHSRRIAGNNAQHDEDEQYHADQHRNESMHAAVCQSGRRDLPALHGRQQVAAAASNQKNE